MVSRLDVLESRVRVLELENRLLATATVGMLTQAPDDPLLKIEAEFKRLVADNKCRKASSR
jgi:hypothetical protein